MPKFVQPWVEKGWLQESMNKIVTFMIKLTIKTKGHNRVQVPKIRSLSNSSREKIVYGNCQSNRDELFRNIMSRTNFPKTC